MRNAAEAKRTRRAGGVPILLGLFVLAGGWIAPLPADAELGDFACVKTRNGALRAVADPAECRPEKEVAVPLAQPGPAGPPGESFRVYDAEGRDLGAFLSMDVFQRYVLVHLDSLDLHVWINRNTGEIVSSNGSILWEQPNCEGQRWVHSFDFGRLQGPIFGTDTLFTVMKEAVHDAPVVSRAQILSFGQFCQNEIPASVLARPNARLVEIDPADVGFAFPVALPLSILPAAE
ncbi:MAG: hypothetical protein ACR2PQ_13030 [Myxococcota bacterium]